MSLKESNINIKLNGASNLESLDKQRNEVLEEEISRWDGFVRALRKEDREAFDQLVEMCRSYASEGSNIVHLTSFEPMVMSIILAQSQRIRQMEKELNLNRPDQPATPDIAKEESTPIPENLQVILISNKLKSSGGKQARLN